MQVRPRNVQDFVFKDIQNLRAQGLGLRTHEERGSAEKALRNLLSKSTFHCLCLPASSATLEERRTRHDVAWP